MATTDLIVLGCSLLLIWRGASRGFLRSVLGPICLLLATLLSAYYYNSSKNLIVALLIGIFGPWVLSFIITNSFKLWHQATDPQWKPNPLSRCAGALLTLIWGWVFILLTLILLTIIPPFVNGIRQISIDVRSSLSYGIIKPFIESKKAGPTPAAAAGAMKTDDLIQLAHDPRFQNIINDPDIQKAIAENNIASLMGNPKFMELTQELMQDPEMLKKLLNLHGQLQQQAPLER